MTVQTRQPRAWPGLPWDDGITWSSRLSVPPTTLPIDAVFVAESVLRVGDIFEDASVVTAYLKAATAAAERMTQRALMPQTWQMVLSGFPASGRIVLERPPLIEIVSVAYYDGDDELQELAVSPPAFITTADGPSSKAVLYPLTGEAFPATAARPDAVTVTYRAGYEHPDDDPEMALIRAGIGLMAGELYKQRSLSVQAINNSASQLQLSSFWRPVVPVV